MLTQDKIDSLDRQFKVRYSKLFANLNKNVYPAALNDNGCYEVPIVSLDPGGTQVLPKDVPAFELIAPAKVRVTLDYRRQETVIHRICIPRDEALIAADKPEYFNYLMDQVISSAIKNYKKSFGDENILRFGDSYMSYQRPGSTGVFASLPEGDVEIRFIGMWAGNEAVV